MAQPPGQPRGPYRPQEKRLSTAKPPLQLQERDFGILEAVWANRFLTRDLLLALFPPDQTRAPRPVATGRHIGSNLDRRLAKLFHHGHLDRIRTVRGGALVYALGQRGAALLKSRQPSLPLSEATDWREKNRDVSNLYVDHALMVARLRTALIVATGQTPATTLDRFERESTDLKATWQHRGRRLYVNPDGFFILRDTARPEGKQRTAFFLEADRSTMTLARLREKFANYAALYADREHQHAFGVPSFRVVTVAKSQERASNLLKLVIDGDSPIDPEHRALFLFTTEETYRDQLQNVFAAVWRAADTPHELRSLIPSPLPRV